MTDDPALEAALAAGLVIAGDEERRDLLQSIAEVARAIFHAKAASIFLHDTAKNELVFEAAWGAGGHVMHEQVTWSGTADRLRTRIDGLAELGVTELVFQPWRPDVRRELETFMATAASVAA